MRWAALFRKAVLEAARDWKILVLTLTFAPFFVVLMQLYFAAGTTVYRVAVVNADEGTEGAALITRLASRHSAGMAEALEVRAVADATEARRLLATRAVDVVVEIPGDFTSSLAAVRGSTGAAPPTVRTLHDYGNPKSVVAAALADYVTFEHAAAATGLPSPVELEARSAGPERRLDDFALYVPALLGLAVMMLMFTAAAPLIREKDQGTLVRLRMSRATAFEWLSAVSAAQVLVGLVTVGLTFATALALGYRTSGPMSALLAVALLSCLALVGISVVVAAYLRTIFDLATIGCFPFFGLMFFSGGMFPLPEVTVATVGGVAIHANDVLPTTHTIAALDKVLNLGQGLGAIAQDLAVIAGLTAAYFALGVWLFARRHLRAR